MITVGVYVRMSQDDALGDPRQGRRGVRRQLDDCREFARERGWPVGKVYEDNDASAFKERRHRPAFEEMLRDLEDEVIGGVVVYALDRVARQPLDLELLIDVYVRARRPLAFAACVEPVDLADFKGQQQARRRVLGALQESESMSRRIARVNRARAESGQTHAGGRRPFGWQEGGMHVDPVEAGLIRKAYRDIMDGGLIGHVRKEWIDAGVRPRPTKASPESHRQINHTSVQSRLVNPRLCGLRSYVPQAARDKERRHIWTPDYVVCDAEGNPVTGDWETIVTVEDWETVTSILQQRRESRSHRTHSTKPNHLLSGVSRCGLCGQRMYPAAYVKGTFAYERYGFRYTCQPSGGGCGRVSRVGPPIDALVENALVSRLLVESRRPCTPDSTATYAVLREHLRGRGGLYLARDRGELDAESCEAAIKAVRERSAPLLTAMQSDTARQRRSAERFEAAALRWPELAVPERREVLREAIARIVVHPAGRGKRFDPSLIQIVWEREVAA